MTYGLVLAGGGVAGIAWELGVLAGICDTAPEIAPSLTGADVVVGTSAGSAVAAQITSGTPLEELYAAQLAEESAELEIELDMMELWTRLQEAATAATSHQDLLRRWGALALATKTVTEEERLVAIAGRLPSRDWPDRKVLITAVGAESGEFHVFDKDSGVALIDAVAASCAVPGVWPPATVGGSRFIDGGMRSVTNADLAAGCDKVLVITPTPLDAPVPQWGGLDIEIEQLKPSETYAVRADAATVAAFGTNPLSASTRGPAARAGREIGRALGAEIAGFWTR
jgi:NTE family protein